jgi:3-oxoacyl-[acyl-carrier-protein] synthase-1
VSSTKSLTGHGLSLAGAMESAFCAVALHEKFTPISAKISELDPMCDGVPVVKDATDHAPKIALNNSSGFGGANVAIVMQRWDSTPL